MGRTRWIGFAPAAAAALLASAPGGAQAACRPASGSASQLVTVDAASATATHASLRLWRRSGACWLPVAGPWPARVGFRGLAARRREGDGTTPVGVFALGPTVYGVAPDPGVRLAYHRLVCGDWWDEDPASGTYNTFRHVPCGASPPFRGGSEALWLATDAYRWFAVIRFNNGPVVAGRGSAIFLHVDVGRATNGCVSLAAGRLVALLRWLRPGARPLIAIDAAA